MLCAALRKKSMTFGCGCDWAESFTALRKKCDMRLRLRLGRDLRCAAQGEYVLRLRLRLGLALRRAAQEECVLRLRLRLG
jgi:sirohydrochlorin ferrochelatase